MVPHDNNNQDASSPSARFIGDMKISSADEILIKSSSLLLPEKISDSFDIHLEDVNYKISDQERKNSTGGFKNVLLNDLELHGQYEVIINSTAGRLNLPSFPSNYDYFTIPIQGGFDMKIKKLKDNVDEDTIVRTGNNNNSSSSDIANILDILLLLPLLLLMLLLLITVILMMILMIMIMRVIVIHNNLPISDLLIMTRLPFIMLEQ